MVKKLAIFLFRTSWANPVFARRNFQNPNPHVFRLGLVVDFTGYATVIHLDEKRAMRGSDLLTGPIRGSEGNSRIVG